MNGGNIGSVVGVIELLWCGIGVGLLFSLEMNGEAGVGSNFGAGLRFAFSRIRRVMCV